MFQDDIKAFLSLNSIVLKKRLGQNFLIDESVLQKIVETAQIEPSDHVVEIGPGIGILTKELVKKAKYVTAIEIDATLIVLLSQYVRSLSLNIIQGNALEIPFPTTPYKIVANIPYHITSPLLRHAFIESEKRPQSLTMLIQREVAEKICDTDNASRLTILVALFGTPTLVQVVKPSAFLPPPKVDSAILHIESFKKPLASTKIIERIFTLTSSAFSQKRKMLRNTIDMQLLEQANIDPTRRPQTLSIEEWITMGNL